MAYTTIKKPSDYFNTKLYTGDDVDGREITTGFATDWTWVKRRNSTNSHIISDSVRGATYKLDSSSSGAEVNNYDGGHLESFTSTGFTMGVGSADFGHLNATGGTYVAWNWLAGGTASSNTDGSITSTVSANTTSGFSICSWTGDGSDATIGHGLGAVPKMIIHKHRSGTVQWNVYHESAGTGGYLRIDGNNAWSSNSGFFGTAPTSSVFSPGSHPYMSGSGNDNIAYIFAEKKGFSKFGSYTGNGSNDGTFVYTGFKPAFVMIKNTTNGNNWFILDNKRTLFNLADDSLFPNSSSAEITNQPTNYGVDILSNGMKMRTSGDHLVNNNNASGNTYIYMAFAEEPLVGDNPATAR